MSSTENTEEVVALSKEKAEAGKKSGWIENCTDNLGSTSKTSKVKSELPKGLKSLGLDRSFEFVPEDHNLSPNVMPLFVKQRTLGQGASCKVFQMRRKSDGADFSVKIMKRNDKWNPILFRQEYNLLTQIKHPNILEYKDCYMDPKNFYICTTLCKGGELFDKIKTMKKFREDEAAQIMRSITSAIAHCHERNIVHRDLKPENILYRTKQQKELVIIDFGDAKIIDENETYEDFVGTAFYLAPECIRKRQGWELKKSDMWTLGVITYLLLIGKPPFYGRDNQEILRKILKASISWPKGSKISKTAKAFIAGLIKKDTKKRMSAEDCLKHPWLTGSAGHDDLGSKLLNDLCNYSQATKLKKVLVRMFSTELTESDHLTLKQQFETLDVDGNGFITQEDLTNFILKQGGSKLEAEEKAAHIISEVDTDGDGQVNPTDWRHAQLGGKIGSNEALLKSHFRRIDEDNDGFITHDELSKLFNWTLESDLITLMIQEIDENEDGKISYPEFAKAMRSGSIGKALTLRKNMIRELTQEVGRELSNVEKN